MTNWELPEGWKLEVSTEQIEVTRDGSLPPYEMDMIRRWVPGKTVAWLTTPDGRTIPLPVPFTVADVKRHIDGDGRAQ